MLVWLLLLLTFLNLIVFITTRSFKMEVLKEYFGMFKIRESDVVKLAIVLQGSKK